MSNMPTIKDLSRLIISLKPHICDDYRAYPDEYGMDEETIPSMLLTIGWNPENGEWDYQTGDTSYTGGAYHYPIWASCAIYRRSNSRELARDLIAELGENIPH